MTEKPSTEVTDSNKSVSGKIKEKKKTLLIVALVIIGIIMLAVISIVTLNLLHEVDGNIKGDFSRKTAKGVEIHGLKAYIPKGWEKMKPDEEDGKLSVYYVKSNSEGEFLACIKLVYLGDSGNELKAININNEKMELLKTKNIDGCSSTSEVAYEDSDWNGVFYNKYKGKGTVVRVDRSNFLFLMYTRADIFSEKEYKKILGAIEFEKYENIELCKDSSCLNKRAAGFVYCDVHRCHKDECKEKAIKGESYCKEHIDICIAKGCTQPRVENCDYCVEHKCAVAECKSIITEGSSYCSTHKCQTRNCKELKIDGANYCATHKCKISGCESSATDGGYCSTHKAQLCKSPGCTNLKVSMKSYCREHLARTLGAGTYVIGKDIDSGTYDINWVSGSGNVFGYDAYGDLILNEIFGPSADWGQIKTYKNLVLSRSGTLEISGGVTIKLTLAE